METQNTHDHIVCKAMDASMGHANDARTEEELRELMRVLGMEEPEPHQLEALGRYVSLARWRYSDTMRAAGL